MFSIVRLIQIAILGACFSFGNQAQAHGITEVSHRNLQSSSEGKRAANADEGEYKTHTTNNDAIVQFEKGFFPYDPSELYTGYYWQGKLFCFFLMFLAELGDKSFILIMVSYHELGGCATFVIGYITLCACHIGAAALGWGISFVIPAFWTKLICVILFLCIGLGLLIMACYHRNSEDIDKSLGKAGHSFAIVAEESTHQNEDAEAKKSDSESDSSSSSEGSDSDEADNQKEGGDESSSSSGDGSADSDSDTESEEEKVEESKATHITKDETDEGKKSKPVARQGTYTPSAAKPAVQNAVTGFDQRNHDSFRSMQLGGKKIQNFCCCGSIATTSAYVLLPLMLIAAEMCDKTQIVAVSMSPNYGFQSIVIGGIFAQFFSCLFACFLSQILKECIATRFWMDILAALLFLAFGLYELIGELIMENSGTWAERKV